MLVKASIHGQASGPVGRLARRWMLAFASMTSRGEGARYRAVSSASRLLGPLPVRSRWG